MENIKKTMDGYRRIRVHKNEVKISTSQCKTDYDAKHNTTLKKRYQIVNGIDVGKHQIVQGIGDGEITIFSITECQKICQFPQTAVVKYSIVGDELFVKVVDDDVEYIYDEVGNLIEKASDYHLSIVFCGCEPAIQKTNKKSGRDTYYSFEGRLVG